MADLLERLAERALPETVQPKRGENYNYPYRWYRKTDGDVVLLQGDPQNRAYYHDKGYVELRETAPAGQQSERAEWEQDIRPQVIKAQREKAAIINTIRRLEERSPGVNISADFDIMTIEECRDTLRQLGEATGLSTRVIMGRVREESPDAVERDLLRGVETQSSIEDLQTKLSTPPPPGTLQGTGYDPITEAARVDRRRRASNGSQSNDQPLAQAGAGGNA
jgi:hypothetical protein